MVTYKVHSLTSKVVLVTVISPAFRFKEVNKANKIENNIKILLIDSAIITGFGKRRFMVAGRTNGIFELGPNPYYVPDQIIIDCADEILKQYSW
ncbi:hypothetical protein OZX69_08170 [Lactobacillus sp. ESL0731]|uniref:hypothetical protein n=1 Tax=unclassified Lactobacillus TaxID=2620435 RepID=UPI0023F84B68|nr:MULTISPECIES: hypothetical protein [unclassified Lactobacillus]WEV50913.1 hypothetical protein OZX63_08165 [Lactobacillus sp. ESL0700]WEV62044.1 hypothetical protein OZX69_08170 [Lactobacillus sp. ESL0731]